MVKEGALNIDFTDEIIDAAAVTHGGAKRVPGSAKAESAKATSAGAKDGK